MKAEFVMIVTPRLVRAISSALVGQCAARPGLDHHGVLIGHEVAAAAMRRFTS